MCSGVGPGVVVNVVDVCVQVEGVASLSMLLTSVSGGGCGCVVSIVDLCIQVNGVASMSV